MNYRVFSIDDIYDLVSAQHCALQLERETGIKSGWYEFASEDEYEAQLNILSGHEEEFEDALCKAAKDVESEFTELENLDEDDFDSDEEFFEARDEIQESIIDKLLISMDDYCY